MEPTAMKRSLPLLLALAGCGQFTPALNPNDLPDLPSAAVQTTDIPGSLPGTTRKRTIIDATQQDITRLTVLDLESGQASAYPGKYWDVGFARSWIRTNGGVSKSTDPALAPPADVVTAGRLFTAATVDAEFDGLTTAWSPSTDTSWADLADGPDANGEPDTIFENSLGGQDLWWYDYDGTEHILTARPVIYVVRSGAGNYYKLRILSYYSSTGVSAVYEIHWASIGPPAP
jgi:hypothetical protein